MQEGEKKVNSPEEKIEQIRETLGEALLMDGFDEAILGICERCGASPVVAYDYIKCVEILVDQGLSRDEAMEYLEFNCVNAYLGEGTPVFITVL